jgi:hypothetical protein
MRFRTDKEQNLILTSICRLKDGCLYLGASAGGVAGKVGARQGTIPNALTSRCQRKRFSGKGWCTPRDYTQCVDIAMSTKEV